MRPFAFLVRPEIGIDFDLDDGRYSLRKAFCQQQEAELTGPGGRWTGDAVEDTLKDLLHRLRAAGARCRRYPASGDLGVVLGRPGQLVRAAETLATAAASALCRRWRARSAPLSSSAASADGRWWMQAPKRLRDTLVTSTGRPRGLLRRGKIDAPPMRRRRRSADLQTRLQEYREDTVDELGRLRGPNGATRTRKKRAETAEAALVQAEEEKKRINALEAAATEAVRAEELAQVRWSAAAQAWQGRQTRRPPWRWNARPNGFARYWKRRHWISTARRRHPGRRHLQGGQEKPWRRAEAILTDAERPPACRYREKAGGGGQPPRGAAQAAERQAATLDTRPGHPRRRCRRGPAPAGKPPDNAGLRLPEPSQPGLFGARDWPPGASRWQAVPRRRAAFAYRRTVLNLDGFGRVTVTPGGDGLANRRNDAEAAAQASKRALADLGVADVAAAETYPAVAVARHVKQPTRQTDRPCAGWDRGRPTGNPRQAPGMRRTCQRLRCAGLSHTRGRSTPSAARKALDRHETSAGTGRTAVSSRRRPAYPRRLG